MTAFDAYDASADLLSVLGAHRAGQRLATRLGAIEGPSDRSEGGSGPGAVVARRPYQSRHRPLTRRRHPDSAAQGPPGHPGSPAAADPLATWLAVLDGMVHSGLKARLLDGGGVFTSVDPHGLSKALEASPRFRRDTKLGSIFHHRKVSFREVSPTDSLHVVIDGNRVWSHIDRVSPLNLDPGHAAHYSPARVLAHNLSSIGEDLTQRARRHRDRLGRSLPVGSRVGTSVSWPPGGKTGAAGPDIASGTDRSASVPFNMIDGAIHLLDTEAAPWSIQLELRVDGVLDEKRLRAAVVDALGRHPMGRARKKPSRRSLHGDSWEIPARVDVDPLRVVACPDDAALERTRARLQSLAVPLAESPPLRIRLARHPEGDVVMLNANHAAMDGFGALRLLRSVARAYSGDDDPIARLNFQRARDLPNHLAAPNLASRIRRQLVLIEKLRDLIQPPARVAGDGASGETGYGFHLVRLSAADTQALRRLRHPGTVNDVLLAALHGAIAGWNAEHGVACGRIGVLVPANLRPAEWGNDMVGNFSLPVRVATTRRSRRSPSAALKAVTAQTTRKKKSGMGTALIELLKQSQLLPLWAKQTMVMLLPVTGNRLVDTAMLSNLGSLDDLPSFGPDAGTVSEVWFSPPARMPLGVAIGAVTLEGRLHLSFRYRLRQFGPEAAERFAGRYLDALRSFIG